MEIELPSFAIPYTDNEDPRCAKERNDMEEPNEKRSNTLSVDPNRVIPYMEQLLPKRIRLRSEKVDPR
jgi:hypothetical protein